VLVIVPALLWLVPRYGAPAAAWVWGAVNAAYMLVAGQLMPRVIVRGAKRRWYLEDVATPVGGAALTALLLRLVAPSGQAHRVTWMTFLAVAGPACAATSLMLAGRIR